jgi:hypothetical protein
VVLMAAILVLGACSEDPFDRPGTWRASGTNALNLRAMAADPAHLARGVEGSTERGQAGSAPITALEAGKRPAVPTTQLTRVGTGGGGGTGAR